MHDQHRDHAAGGDKRAEHRRQRQLALAELHRQRHPVRAVAIRLGVAQATDRQVSDRERERRAERVDPDQEVEVLRRSQPRGDQPGEHDQHVRSRALGVQAPETAWNLAVGGQRVGQAREPEHRRVGGRDERHRRHRRHQVHQRLSKPVGVHVSDHADHRRVQVARRQLVRPSCTGSAVTATSAMPT